MSEENKALVRRIFDEVWESGNLNVIEEVYAPNVVNHNLPPDMPGGIEGTKGFVGMFYGAFPNTKMTVEDMLTDGDKVVTRWSSVGKHEGELMGIPATGKEVHVTGISIDRVEGGKVAESWGQFDMMGLMTQLGVVPPPGG